tara:strand:+ start:998 stop:1777 length:780 start_codon:yes stop_codon:yes gene_type:complete
MFEQFSAPDHVIAIHFSDKVTGDDVGKYKAIFDEKLAKHDRLSAVIDMTGLSDMSANALVEGAKADMAFLGHINQFAKCAIISDKEIWQVAVQVADPFLPTLEMRAFTPAQRDEAIKWAADVSAAPPAAQPAFRFMPTSKDNVLAFELNGMVSAEEMPSVIEKVDAFLEKHEKVRLLNRIKHFGGLDPSIFMQGGLISMKLAALQKVERYAVVGAPTWMAKIVEAMNPAFPDMDVRTFPADHEDEAWAWLGAKPAKQAA